MPGHPSWLDDDRRRIIASYTDKPHTDCRCQWDKTGEPFGEGRYWSLTERWKDCPIHGQHGEN